MEFQHRWGGSWREKLEFLEGLREEGRNVPSLDNRPELDLGLLQYWEAFHVLSPSRQMGMAVGFIPLEEMRAYLDIFGIEEAEERRRLVQYIQTLDQVFVEHQHKKSKEESPTTDPENTIRERRRGRKR